MMKSLEAILVIMRLLRKESICLRINPWSKTSVQFTVYFENLLNHQVRHIKLGHGSFLTLGFGKDRQVEALKRGKKEVQLRSEWYFGRIYVLWEVIHSQQAGSDKWRWNRTNRGCINIS